jgi:hypothetical protein
MFRFSAAFILLLSIVTSLFAATNVSAQETVGLGGSNADLARAVRCKAAIKRPVIVIATSRGTRCAAEKIASGV